LESVKKLFILLIALGISISTIAGLKSKNVVGEWKSSMIVSNAEMTGSFIFYEKSGELQGQYIPSEGTKSNISKIKINNKNNTLCFEIPRETDVPIEFILIVEDKKFRGKGWINEANFEITGEKIN
jgi:hypothetical protein